MEPIINQQVPEFKVQAYHNDKFITVTNKDIEGKWAIFFFYPADFTFVCPTELEDLASKYEEFKKIEDEGMAYRGTFVVDPEGKIKIAEIQDNNIGRNADELFRKVQAAQFVASHPGDVCPAKWKEGAETLKPSIDLVGKL